jgi:RNA polymerase sigma-70 factor (ECF subfamily)
VSAARPVAVSGLADRDFVIQCANHPTPLDLGTDAGMRHALLVYGPELRSFAARRLGSWASAEDAVQETLLRAWKSAERFDAERGSLRGWLFSILRNLLVDLARARARRPVTTAAVVEAGSPDETELVLGSLTINAALRKLSADHRQVIYHCYVRQRPHSEVAELLGVPVGTIRSRLFYARDAMKNALAAVGATDVDSRPDAA